ncbi:hypothetical protein KR018_012198, partial [Drosophila ironensis]
SRALRLRIHHVNGRHLNVQASDSWHQPGAYERPRNLSMGPNVMAPAPICALDEYCLENILERLSLPDQVHFARTCSRFRAVYQIASPRLHRIMNLRHFDDMTVWDMRDFFSLSGNNVQQYQGVIPTARSQRLCDFLAHNCKNVKFMELFHSPLSSRCMYKIFAKMKKLEELELPMSNTTDYGVLALRKLPNLKLLNLCGNPLSGSTLYKLTGPIEALSLNECVTFEAFHLTRICKSLTHLKELSIKNINTAFLNSYKLLVVENACPALEILRMTAFEGDEYEYIAQLPSLKHLTVYTKAMGRTTLRLELFQQLVEHKTEQLKVLEISGNAQVSRAMMNRIGMLKSLKQLLLPRIETDNVIEELAHLDQLERLSICHAFNVIGSTVLKLFCACPMLTFIRLDECVDPCDKLVLGIISRVRKEMANREMHRKLPIELSTFIQGTITDHLIKNSETVPKDIINVKCTSLCEYNVMNIDFANMLVDDYDFDPDDLDLDEDSDDDLDDLLSNDDIYDVGFLDDSNDEPDNYD